MSSIGKIRRLLHVLERLQSGRIYNAGELADFCKVSRRTIFRDIKTLQDSGVEILHDSSRNGYWISSGAYLPPTDFTLAETLSLMLLAQSLGGKEHGVPFFSHARDAALKLQSSIPNHLRQYVGELTASVSLKTESQQTQLSANQQHYERILESLTTRSKIRLQYDSFYEGGVIRTLVSPYRLLFQRRAWYVIGRSSLHRAIRTFHVGRIKESELLEDSFEIPPRFSLSRYLGQAWKFVRERGERHHVVVRFQPLVAKNVAEVAWHKTQQLSWNDDGSLDFSVTVDGLNEISWWIMGYADQAQVLGPAELIELISKRLQNLVQMYGINVPRPPRGRKKSS